MEFIYGGINFENLYKKIGETFGGGTKKFYEIIQPRLSGKIRKKPDWMYVKKRNEREFGLGEADLQERLDIFNAFFQPERKISQVFVPTNKYLFQRVMGGKPPTKIYKGVSFNPLLNDYGERFDNLDFFSWIKRAQKVIPMEFYALDAGTYWLINALEENPRFVYGPKLAENVVDFLMEKLETPRGREIKKMADIRNKYLRAMGELLEPKPYVISANDLWKKKEADYLENLQKAILFCTPQVPAVFPAPAMIPSVGAPVEINGVKKVEPLFDEYSDKVPKKLLVEIDKFVKYRSYGKDFEKWYTPLVIAEALYLYNKFGVDAKLGPTSERSFDGTIRNSIALGLYKRDSTFPDIFRRTPYLTIWYTRPFDGKMKYEDRIFFNDEPEKVEEKLSKNDMFREWTAEIVAPFSKRKEENLNNTDRLVEEVSKLKERINKRVEELYTV